MGWFERKDSDLESKHTFASHVARLHSERGAEPVFLVRTVSINLNREFGICGRLEGVPRALFRGRAPASLIHASDCRAKGPDDQRWLRSPDSHLLEIRTLCAAFYVNGTRALRFDFLGQPLVCAPETCLIHVFDANGHVAGEVTVPSTTLRTMKQGKCDFILLSRSSFSPKFKHWRKDPLTDNFPNSFEVPKIRHCSGRSVVLQRRRRRARDRRKQVLMALPFQRRSEVYLRPRQVRRSQGMVRLQRDAR
jgi:hypothetical protein